MPQVKVDTQAAHDPCRTFLIAGSEPYAKVGGAPRTSSSFTDDFSRRNHHLCAPREVQLFFVGLRTFSEEVAG